MRLVLSKLEKKLVDVAQTRGVEDQTGWLWATVLITADANFLRCEHTKRHTWWGQVGAIPRWADWLVVGAPSPIRGRLLWVWEFENANSWKARKNPVQRKTHHESHISTATATTSKRRAKTHVPRVSPYSPASIDPELVEIVHV